MTDQKRRPWTEDENNSLIRLWDSIGSISLIAMILDRSPSSVQTQASRIGLPRRFEEGVRHRRRWTPEDEARLDAEVGAMTAGGGRIMVGPLSDALERSIDAVVAHLAERFGGMRELVDRIVLPDPATLPTKAIKATDRAAKEGNGRAKTRKCLSCLKPFWSEGPQVRICNKCKKDCEDYSWDW